MLNEITSFLLTALTWYGYYFAAAFAVGTLFAIRFAMRYRRFCKNNPKPAQ